MPPSKRSYWTHSCLPWHHRFVVSLTSSALSRFSKLYFLSVISNRLSHPRFEILFLCFLFQIVPFIPLFSFSVIQKNSKNNMAGTLFIVCWSENNKYKNNVIRYIEKGGSTMYALYLHSCHFFPLYTGSIVYVHDRNSSSSCPQLSWGKWCQAESLSSFLWSADIRKSTRISSIQEHAFEKECVLLSSDKLCEIKCTCSRTAALS